jgi:hypothetical protein
MKFVAQFTIPEQGLKLGENVMEPTGLSKF